MAVLIAATIVAATFVAIIWLAIREPKQKPSTEMTDKDVRRYREAARILSRLVNIVDVDGLMSDDNVSAETRKQINAWLADYKKGLRSK